MPAVRLLSCSLWRCPYSCSRSGGNEGDRGGLPSCGSGRCSTWGTTPFFSCCPVYVSKCCLRMWQQLITRASSTSDNSQLCSPGRTDQARCYGVSCAQMLSISEAGPGCSRVANRSSTVVRSKWLSSLLWRPIRSDLSVCIDIIPCSAKQHLAMLKCAAATVACTEVCPCGFVREPFLQSSQSLKSDVPNIQEESVCSALARHVDCSSW